MKFGLFGSAQAIRGDSETAPRGRGFHSFIEESIEAEALGYRATFLVEHHFTGIGQISAPLTLLTWLAARTTTLRLGTAVIVLPWHNPVLLAEQAATLDLLSGGRLDLGIGKGYRHSEFAGFRMPMEEAESRFDEAFEIITKSWTCDEKFSHHGKFWQFEDIVVEPPPSQKPHPALWIAAGAPASIRKVAARGCNLLLDQFATPAQIGERIDLFKSELLLHGQKYDPSRVAVARYFCVNDDQAELEAAFGRLTQSNAGMVKLSRRPDGKGRSHILGYTDREGGPMASAVYGTPDEVSAQIGALRDVGVDYILLNTNDAGQSMRRFWSDIMSNFTGR